MKIIFSMMAFVVVGLLTGCKEEAKSQVWYKEHPDELVKVYKRCKISGEDSQNCRNALDASMLISGNSQAAKEIIEFDRQKRFKNKTEE